MPTEILKVKGKQRTIDDTKEGLVYKLTLVDKEGKRGEPTYRKIQVVIEEGKPEAYSKYEPDEMVKVTIDAAHRKLDEFKEEPE